MNNYNNDDYIVITSNNLVYFQQNVNKAMKRGFTPSGGLLCVQQKKKLEYLYMQAMIKKK